MQAKQQGPLSQFDTIKLPFLLHYLRQTVHVTWGLVFSVGGVPLIECWWYMVLAVCYARSVGPYFVTLHYHFLWMVASVYCIRDTTCTRPMGVENATWNSQLPFTQCKPYSPSHSVALICHNPRNLLILLAHFTLPIISASTWTKFTYPEDGLVPLRWWNKLNILQM